MTKFDSITTSLYPWDVIGDPAAAALVASSGVKRVSLPALYHAVRASTLRHPDHRIVETHSTALFTEYDYAFWRSRPLAPNAGSPWIGQKNAFEAARDALRSEGLAVDAWTVLMHVDGLQEQTGGGVHLRNAIGDSYPWALCPRAPGVLEYAIDIVRAVAATGADGLMLEACGVYGFDHLSSHDKTAAAAFTETDKALLSLCFCPECRHDIRAADIDDAGLAAAVLASLGHTSPDAPAADGLHDALGDTAKRLATIRARTNTEFQNEIIGEARRQGFSRVSIQSSADIWAAGFSAAVANPAIDVDVAIVNCNGPEPEAVAQLTTMDNALDGISLGAFYGLPARADRGRLERRFTLLAESGARELHLYHFGLASTPTLGETAAALAVLE